MVKSTLKNNSSKLTQLKSTNELTPNSLLKYKSADMASEYIESNSRSSKKKTPQHVTFIIYYDSYKLISYN